MQRVWKVYDSDSSRDLTSQESDRRNGMAHRFIRRMSCNNLTLHLVRLNKSSETVSCRVKWNQHFPACLSFLIRANRYKMRRKAGQGNDVSLWMSSIDSILDTKILCKRYGIKNFNTVSFNLKCISPQSTAKKAAFNLVRIFMLLSEY